MTAGIRCPSCPGELDFIGCIEATDADGAHVAFNVLRCLGCKRPWVVTQTHRSVTA
jgi:hypothetical protein